MILKPLKSILIASTLMLASSVYALNIPSVDHNSDTNTTLVHGKANPYEDVNIIVQQDGVYHYLDTTTASATGDYTFKTTLPSNQSFETVVTSASEEVRVTIETPKAPEDTTQPDDNEDTSSPDATPSQKYVTLSIDKKTIDKGYVYSPNQIAISSGDTVWDVLKHVLDEEDIDYTYNLSSTYDSVYVQSIDGDGEFDYGQGSGWMYGVDGVYPDYSSSLYKLYGGEEIAWRYTTNYGEDLKESSGGTTGGIGGGTSPSSPNEDLDEESTEEPLVGTTDEVDPPLIGSEIFSDFNTVSKWAQDDILWAVHYNLISGYEDGTFKPQKPVTRAEFVSVLVRTLYGTDAKASTSYAYDDVKDSDWFKPYVDLATEKGITQGYGDMFLPHEFISREQMAAMLVRGLGLESSETVSLYKEEIRDFDTIATWAQQDVLVAYSEGLIAGIDGSFKPKDTVTREVAGVIALRAYNWLNPSLTEETKTESLVPQHVTTALDNATTYLLEKVSTPRFGVMGGEWAVFGLARRGVVVPENYFETYYDHIVEVAQFEHEKESRKWSTKVTETQRLAIAVAAIGKNPEDVGGVNLVDYSFNKGKYMDDLSEADQVLGGRQGLNELVFGLITMDLKNTPTPEDALITREEVILNLITNYQAPNGGFSLQADAQTGEVDVTAMAIQALAPYYTHDDFPHVKVAIDEAIHFLAKEEQLYDSSESLAQTIVALCTLNLDPTKQNDFMFDNKDLVSHLLSYQTTEGGFMHLKDQSVDQMATEQAYYALVAYERFLNEQSSLYDMMEE